jgi:CHAD domain-containing protein/transposase
LGKVAKVSYISVSCHIRTVPVIMTINDVESNGNAERRLAQLAGDPALPVERQRVARVLLLYSQGYETSAIAGDCGLSPSRVRFWRKMYREHGMNIFEPDFTSEKRRGKRVPSQHRATDGPMFPEMLLEQLRTLDEDALDDTRRTVLHIALGYADGRSTSDISREVGLSQSRTRYWRNAIQRQGMELFAITRADAGDTQTPEEAETDAPHAPPRQSPAARERKGASEEHSMDAGLPLSSVARVICGKQFAELLKQSKSKKFGEDPEVVHRMRVATRRLRSAFVLFANAFKPKQVEELRKGLRRLARLLGKVRDLDVLLMHMQRHIDTLEGNEQQTFLPLMAVWRQEQARHLSTLITHIQSDNFATFQQRFADFLAHPDKGDAREMTNDAGLPLHIGAIAPIMIMQRYADIVAFGPYLDTATLDLLHALRIHCKKLRYTVEFFRGLLGAEARILLRAVVAMQDLLGEIQDAQTAGQLITAFVDDLERRQLEVTFTERINPAPLLHYLATRQAEKHHLLASVFPAWVNITNTDFRKALHASIMHIDLPPGIPGPMSSSEPA